jgi:hypothetical protein
MGPVVALDSAMSRDAARVRIAAQPLAELNPADPLGFVDDTVGHVFARLRREDPIHRSHSPIAGIGTYWSVTRYQDIHARHIVRFSVGGSAATFALVRYGYR